MTIIDLTPRFSKEAQQRQPSKLKVIAKYNQPDFAFLAAGIPLPKYFAWDSISASTLKPPFTQGIDAKPLQDTKLSFDVTYDATEFDFPLTQALQYGAATGPQPLVKFLKEHTQLIHKVPYQEWDLVTTAGSTHGWDAILRTLCDPGDSILVENYAFSSALETAKPLGVEFIPVKLDALGIIPEELEKVLSSSNKLPKLLYTVPTGQNPTGSSLSIERRKEIYKICSKYDILIVEDEPYYFLQLDDYVATTEKLPFRNVSDDEFVQNLVPSFLSLDTQGRVIRIDSFSKVLAPGSRIGWIVGQKSLIEKILRQYEVSIQTPSGFSSSIIYGTLQRWGHSGYIDWLKALRHEYSYKRNLAISFAQKYITEKYAKVNIPTAGMFFTIEFDANLHPEFSTKYQKNPILLETAIFEKSIEYKVALVPGSWFEVNNSNDTNIFFFRGTYASTEKPNLEDGLLRFGKAVKEIYNIN